MQTTATAQSPQSPTPSTLSQGTLFRYSPWDALMVAVSLLHGVAFVLLLFVQASVPFWLSGLLIAGGVCWSSNTVSHNHLHNPFFQRRWLNQVFSMYLTVLVSIPQSIWKERHLWHHAGEPKSYRKRGFSLQKGLEFLGIALVWVGLVWWLPHFFLWAYLPGFAVGLLFCLLQGHYEHMGEVNEVVGTSHYGRLYNFFWFNDGFHAEHHQHPRMHWRALPGHQLAADEVKRSAWPPHLRWFASIALVWNRWQGALLGWLERRAIASPMLQRWMLESHEAAFRSSLAHISEQELSHIAIVGGGLFPRTLLVLLPLLPKCHFTIIEREEAHIIEAKSLLAARGVSLEQVTFLQQSFDRDTQLDADGLVIPMAFLGERQRLYEQPPAPHVWIHDWIWGPKGSHSTIIAWWLLKRLTLVSRERPTP